MGTGKRRINSAIRGFAARVVGSRGLGPELARVVEPELALAQEAAELELAQGVAELALAQGVAELERGPGAVVPEHVRAVAVLEHGQVVAVRVLGHLRAHLEAQRRTKSATAVHHRDLAQLLAAEDSAAVAETTREPAATEAVAAWVAAGTAVAVTVAVAG
jgi:hypothetical protein